MPRPRIYDENHFKLTSYTTKEGRTNIVGYRNKWDPVKKQSRTEKRFHVGVLNPDTGEVRLSMAFLGAHPEYEGKRWYYEQNELVERSEEVLKEQEQRKPADDISSDLSYGATWACWKTFEAHHIVEDIKSAFGAEDGENLLRLAVYQFLEARSMDCYDEWRQNVWLPKSAPLCGQRISDLLSRVDHQKMMDYFKLRFNRCKEKHQDKDGREILQQYLAIDSTGISTYSETIDTAAYGHAKQNPELKQINFTLGVDYLTGDVCYAYESEGSINDKSLYPHILQDMQNHGFDLTNTALVTDRGYESMLNIQKILNLDLQFLTGVPLVEKGIRDRFIKYKDSFENLAFWDSDLEIAARTFEENWVQNLDGGNVRKKIQLNLYRDPNLAPRQTLELLRLVDRVLRDKNDGKRIDPDDWRRVSRYISEVKGEENEKVGVKNLEALNEMKMLAGCYAIRTNCMINPFDALRLYRQRNLIETAFRQFKVLNEGARLRTTQTSYIGKLMVHVLAQTLRMILQITAQKNKNAENKLPGDSLTQAVYCLQRVRAIRPGGRAYWVMKEVPKKARDIFTLLGVPVPDPKFQSL